MSAMSDETRDRLVNDIATEQGRPATYIAGEKIDDTLVVVIVDLAPLVMTGRKRMIERRYLMRNVRSDGEYVYVSGIVSKRWEEATT